MILNRQRRVRVPMKVLDAFLAQACQALRICPGTVTICLVTNSEMTRWNNLYRGKNRPTDVLSFPAQAEKRPAKVYRSKKNPSRRRTRDMFGVAFAATPDGYLGDIAIAPAVARSNAESEGRKFDDEMRILILHGILHLMGYDHEADTGQMNRREQRVRRALGLG